MQCTADDIRLHRVAFCKKTEPLTSLPRTLPRFQAQYRGQFQKKRNPTHCQELLTVLPKKRKLCVQLERFRIRIKLTDLSSSCHHKTKIATDTYNSEFKFFGLKRVNGRGFRRQQQSGILQTCCSYAEVEHIMVGWGFETISNERHSVYFSQGKLDLQIMTMERNINYRRSKGVVSQGYNDSYKEIS